VLNNPRSRDGPRRKFEPSGGGKREEIAVDHRLHGEASVLGRSLPEGGTIGVFAPSNPYFNRSDILRGVEWWESRGYRVKLADGVWERDDYVAGDPRVRARDLMATFADPEVDVVQPLTGGYGAAELLPLLDFDVIADNPKPFLGYSDITALHVAIRQQTGLATFYGPNLMSMGDVERPDWDKELLVRTLSGDGAGEIPRDPEDPYVRAIVGGTERAPLVGGCLWLLQHSIGTPWEFDATGCILFFEDVNAPPYVVDGLLLHLHQARKLEGVAGLLVGEMDRCDWREDRPETPRTRSLEDVLEERLEPLGVPVLYRLPLGHGKHLATLPLGVQATLDADRGRVTIDQPALASNT
jgi:muramoyltetrapeptide carboxypeptidase